MRRVRRFGAFCVVVFLAACGAVWCPALMVAEPAHRTGESQHHKMTERSIDQHILPRLESFAGKASELSAAVHRWCEDGRPGTPDRVHQAFEDAVVSWAGAEIIRFGPARKQDRLVRIAFWPDRRGVVRRQTRRALAAGDPKLLSTEEIAEQSVALQGLPTLELLLYPAATQESEETARYRCRLAEAIAGNVAKLADGLHADWMGPDGWRAMMLSAGPENAVYKSDAEAAAEIVKSLLAALQIIRQNEILPWQETVEAGKRWAGLPFEHSGLSKRYLRAGVESARSLHRALQLDAFAESLGKSDPDKAWMQSWLQNAYRYFERELAGFDLPAIMQAAGKTDASHIRRAKFYVNGLVQIIGREIAPAAKLFLGFNELDGD